MRDKPSRWMIFQRGMEALNEDEQRQVIADLLDRQWSGLDAESLDRLRQMLAGGARHSSQQLRDRVAKLDWKAVDRIWNENLNLVAANPDGAIRAARTALESVCKHIVTNATTNTRRAATYRASTKLQLVVWSSLLISIPSKSSSRSSRGRRLSLMGSQADATP